MKLVLLLNIAALASAAKDSVNVKGQLRGKTRNATRDLKNKKEKRGGDISTLEGVQEVNTKRQKKNDKKRQAITTPAPVETTTTFGRFVDTTAAAPQLALLREGEIELDFSMSMSMPTTTAGTVSVEYVAPSTEAAAATTVWGTTDSTPPLEESWVSTAGTAAATTVDSLVESTAAAAPVAFTEELEQNVAEITDVTEIVHEEPEPTTTTTTTEAPVAHAKKKGKKHDFVEESSSSCPSSCSADVCSCLSSQITGDCLTTVVTECTAEPSTCLADFFQEPSEIPILCRWAECEADETKTAPECKCGVVEEICIHTHPKAKFECELADCCAYADTDAERDACFA